MIALGTSHTAGDCDGPTYGPTSIKITAYDMIANELGLELVRIGMSGCMNTDLLQATNELVHHKALNDNCKLFMLEPRLGDRTARLPVEAVMPGHFYHKDAHPFGLTDEEKINYSESTSDKLHPQISKHWKGFGIIESWAPKNVNLNMATIQQVSIDARNLDALSGYMSTLTTQPFFESMAFYGHSPFELLNSVTIIDSIRHIVEANNVKFRWQVVTVPMNDDDISKKLLGEHSTLFDNYISIADIQSETGIKCGCGHYNKTGHRMWYNKTIDHLR